MSSDWFGCVLVTPIYGADVFSESVTESSSCFTNVKLFAISASYAADDIGGGAREVIGDLNDRLGSDIFSTLCTKGQVLHRARAHLKASGWSLV